MLARGFRCDGGKRHIIIIDLPALQIPHNDTLDKTYLFLIVIASALLSFWVARLTAVPLRRLTDAAHRFSLSIDPEAIPVTGPREVRAALETFNLMQQRVRDGFRERTHILAAIAHDLQTPITRLRLRLEQVKDGPCAKGWSPIWPRCRGWCAMASIWPAAPRRWRNGRWSIWTRWWPAWWRITPKWASR
jgi:signal transduction histidine kinase